MTDTENSPTEILAESLPLNNSEISARPSACGHGYLTSPSDKSSPVKPDGVITTDAGLTTSPHACMHGDTTNDMLLKQLGALDTLFSQTMDDYATSTSHSTNYSQVTRLTFALRLQNQCLRTAKALSAMEYMQSLQRHNINTNNTPTNTIEARPLPHDLSKQTRNDKNGR